MPPALSVPAPVSRSLSRLCTIVRWLAVGGAIAAVAAPVWMWSSAAHVECVWRSAGGLGNAPMTVDARAMSLGILVTMLPVGLALYTLREVWRLFGAYAGGMALSRPAQCHLRGFGLGVLALGLAGPVFRTLLTLVLTLGNVPGQRLVMINVSGDDYLNVLVGAVLLAVAKVMADAVRAAEENAQFI